MKSSPVSTAEIVSLLQQWKADREIAFALMGHDTYSYLRSYYIDRDWELTAEAHRLLGGFGAAHP